MANYHGKRSNRLIEVVSTADSRARMPSHIGPALTKPSAESGRSSGAGGRRHAFFAVKSVNFQTGIFDGGAVYRSPFCKMRKRLWRSQDEHLRPPSLFLSSDEHGKEHYHAWKDAG